MTFINQILVFGAAAFAIPLIIHILNRSRFRTIHWAAMHLLDSIVRVNHKRFRLEQLLLLLIRCAIPIALALCLARPLLIGWSDLSGDAPVSVVILLDTSYSMDAASENGTRLEEAIQQTVDILKSLSRGSEVAIIETGGQPTPLTDQPIFSPELMIEQVEQIRGGYGASQMTEAVDLGLATLAAMTQVRRELIVISDFQDADWPAADAPFFEKLEESLDDAAIPPVITLIQVGESVAGNVSVDDVEFSSDAIGAGQSVVVRVKIRNHGVTIYEKARIRLLIDGEEDSVVQMNLEPNASTQAVFRCQFPTAGSHVVTAELGVDDPLSTDNRLSAALNVWQQIDVLLVDGAPSTQPLQGEVDFLSVALTPFTIGRFKLTDLMVAQTTTQTNLNDEAVQRARVVILANVDKLAPEQLTVLDQYVRSGGSLLIFAGDRIDADWYNQTMYEDSAGLLPLRFAASAGNSSDKPAAPDDPVRTQVARIVPQHFEHPALSLFNDPSNGDVADAEIRRWYRLAPTLAPQEGESRGDAATANLASDSSANDTGTSAELPAGVTVMARLSTGDPFMVEKRVGDGVVVQVATACDADWSDLPLRPVFLPMIQQLVAAMASQVTPPRNVSTGEALVAVFPADESEAPVSLTTPDGERKTVVLEGGDRRSLARYVATRQPGVYTLVGPDAKTVHYVARSSRDESNLQMLDESGVAGIGGAMSADSFQSAAQYLKRDRSRRHGSEIWKFLLACVLGLMFIEVVLQQRFARTRS